MCSLVWRWWRRRGKGDAHEVDVADAVFFHLGDVFAQIATAEDAAVDFRMQGFHAAVEHFGKTGIVGNFDNGNACISQELCCTAGREDFNTEPGQGFGQIRLRLSCRIG